MNDKAPPIQMATEETFVVHESVVTEEPSRLISRLGRYVRERPSDSSSDESEMTASRRKTK